ncbi:envelope stress response membrane protein PspB [Kiloniella sp. EL199]|uniref:envelope stress response membrane protein PspB n=1 Tax=Kiloniella sp. EL199 TaxID=2107581 RepID=UPI000EA3D7A0|nr:envelope stress response membrane protein PspB [Kiloniella sp. EL199]
MSFAVAFFVPLVVFLSIVAPLWIIFHYITKWKTMKKQDLGNGMVAVPKEELLKMRDVAKKLADRVATLEKVLEQD